jgi:hypothetical protein
MPDFDTHGIDEDEDSRFEPPCPVAQQGVAFMFGFIFGVFAHTIAHDSLYTLLAVCAGLSFGFLGSQVESPLSISAAEFSLLLAILFPLAWLLSFLLRYDFAGIIGISLPLSAILPPAKFCYSTIFNIIPLRRVKVKLEDLEEAESKV